MATSGLYGNTAASSIALPSGSESSGLYGNNTNFGGTYFEWLIFQESATAPATPTGGSWNFVTNIGTAPAGWTSAPPTNPTNPVWFSIALVNSKSTATLVWSATAPLVKQGIPGVGVPIGGTTGQTLAKTSSVDYATAWVTPAGGGTVSSVGLSAPSFLSVSNSPVTTSGTLALSYSGTALPVANGGTGITSFGTGVAAFLGTPTSANLASAVTDETGTGSLVFATSPSLVTPALGTPSALVGTNITGTATNFTASNVTTNANLTGGVTSIGNAATVITNANLTGPITSVGNTTSVASQTGTGSVFVMQSSPTLTTPALGTPSSGNFGTGAFTWPTFNQNTTGTASNITGTTNSTITTLSSLSLPGSQVSGNISGNAANVTGIVPVLNGGTGTTTPALVAGTNVTITGAWPNQTINSSGGGIGTSVAIADEGTVITAAVSSINFTGTGVVATAIGSAVTVAITSGGGSGDVVGPSSSTDNAIARFDLTTGKIIQNSTVILDDNGNATNVNAVGFDITPATLPTAQGTLYWDNADNAQTLSLVMEGGNAIQQIGQEQYFRVKCSAAITEGQTVMFTGSVGASGGLTAAPASGLTNLTASYFIGVATESGAINDWIYITSFGLVRNINTSGGAESWVDGQILYYNPLVAGGLTKTEPAAPTAKIEVAAVVFASSTVGSIFVRPIIGVALDDLNDVESTGAVTDDLLQYDVGGFWKHAAPSSVTGIGSAINVTGVVAPANGGTGITSLGTGVATFLGTPSSANLAAAVTGETGSGALVFATSPTLVTPALGTPSALVGTNITGTASGLTAGTVTTNANLTGGVTSIGNAATVVTNANLTGGVTSVGNATTVVTNANLTGVVTSVGNATSLGSFSSANLAAALTDETGSGVNVFATSPSLSGVVLNDGYTEEVFAVTGTTPALSPTNGSIQTWTLTANSTPTAGTWAAGQSMTLMINDGTAYTITWTSLAPVWVGGTAPTLATTGFTVIQFWKVGTTIYGAYTGAVA